MERIETIKETINKLQRTAYYESFVESFEDQEEQMIPEEVQNDLIDRLTIRTFNEELKSVFPYIYKFIDESEIDVVELGADDLISEEQLDERVTPEWLDIYSKAKELLAKGMTPEQVAKQLGVQGPNNGMAGSMGGNWGAINKAVNELKQSQKPTFESPEDQFENFMNDIVREDKNEIISSNNDAQSAAIEKLNTILAQNMQVGPNGDNAVMTLKGLIDEPSFIDAVKAVPAETDLNDLIKGWIETEHEDLLGRLEFPSDEAAQEPAPAEPAPAPDEAAPAPVAAEPAPAPAPAPTEPAPAPVAEASDTVEKDADGNIKSWKHEGDWKKSTEKKNPRGKVTNASGQALKKTIAMAKKSGATLETQMDFGDRVMTIAEIIKDCGMTPQDVGYEAPEQEGGLPGMLKYISGFYNKDEGNFPLGGMRVKIKVKKAFEDGEFDGAGEEDLLKVIKFIDAKDPSGNEHNQITRLAGIQKPAAQAQPKQGLDISALETQLQSISETPTVSYGQDQSLASIVHLAGLAK
jgi:hypothetical protein